MELGSLAANLASCCMPNRLGLPWEARHPGSCGHDCCCPHSGPFIAGDSGRLAPLHKDGTALSLAAEKRAAVVMEGSAFGALAQTAVQGFAAGWEIPVTCLPADR